VQTGITKLVQREKNIRVNIHWQNKLPIAKKYYQKSGCNSCVFLSKIEIIKFFSFDALTKIVLLNHLTVLTKLYVNTCPIYT